MCELPTVLGPIAPFNFYYKIEDSNVLKEKHFYLDTALVSLAAIAGSEDGQRHVLENSYLLDSKEGYTELYLK